MPFPRFEDGDVEIRFNSVDEPYILHSWVLALHSPWFKASLSDRWRSAARGGRSSKGGAASGDRRVYELRFDKDSSSGSLMCGASSGTEVVDQPMPRSSKHRSTEESLPPLTAQRVNTMKAHRDILNALYHVSPTFVGNTDWTPEAKHYCELLCMTADFYSCQQILDLHIDNYLRQQSESILMDFEEAPVQMLSFGLNIKSSFVTKEACVHIIGENVKSYAAMRSELVGLEMAELINEKRTALAEQLRAVDFELLRLQLFISPNNERDHRARQIAVNVFRQHITNRLDMGQLSELGTNFAVPYREIARGAIPDDVHIAETHCPPSSHVKALRFGFQIAMRELVDEAKEIVDPVLQDVTQLKGGYNVDGKLLCMGISDEELPWVAKKD